MYDLHTLLQIAKLATTSILKSNSILYTSLAMAADKQPSKQPPPENTECEPPAASNGDEEEPKAPIWRRFFGASKATQEPSSSEHSMDGYDEIKSKPEKWSLGVLNDKETDEVPGTS